MKIKLDLYSSTQLRAFAKFAEAVADDIEEREKRPRDRSQILRDIMETSVWRNYSGEGGEADSAKAPEEGSEYQPGDEVQVELPEAAATVEDEPVKVQATALRERGKPSPGKVRRTAAEVAEDKAADEADARASAVYALQADTGLQISTGENRVGPDDPSEEDQAQDAADEAAEQATRDTGGLTLDNLRHAVGAYQKVVGMQAAIDNVPKLLGCAMIDVPADKLAEAIATIEAATAEAREEARGEPADPSPEPTATREDVIAAMMAYAKKYDGEGADPSDATSMPFTNQDAPKCFALLFGEGVTKLSQIPATPEAYAKTVGGLREMLEKNPFGRAA